jgi:hypothetical protein
MMFEVWKKVFSPSVFGMMSEDLPTAKSVLKRKFEKKSAYLNTGYTNRVQNSTYLLLKTLN